MRIFVDTSALYALLDRDDGNHRAAAGQFDAIASARLLTHNYVVVETTALVQRRLEPAATRALLAELLPAVEVIWVDEPTHQAATSALLAALRRRVSLVDWVSFEVMRRIGIKTAFAFDRDFAAQGFEAIP